MLLCDATIPNFQNEKPVSMLNQIMLIMTNFNIFLKQNGKKKNTLKIIRSYMSSSGGNQVDGLPPFCNTGTTTIDP